MSVRVFVGLPHWMRIFIALNFCSDVCYVGYIRWCNVMPSSARCQPKIFILVLQISVNEFDLFINAVEFWMNSLEKKESSFRVSLGIYSICDDIESKKMLPYKPYDFQSFECVLIFGFFLYLYILLCFSRLCKELFFFYLYKSYSEIIG